MLALSKLDYVENNNYAFRLAILVKTYESRIYPRAKSENEAMSISANRPPASTANQLDVSAG